MLDKLLKECPVLESDQELKVAALWTGREKVAGCSTLRPAVALL